MSDNIVVGNVKIIVTRDDKPVTPEKVAEAEEIALFIFNALTQRVEREALA